MLLSQRVKHADKISFLFLKSSSVSLLKLSQLPAMSILFGSNVFSVGLIKTRKIFSLLL
jgi:hypothetical protein